MNKEQSGDVKYSRGIVDSNIVIALYVVRGALGLSKKSLCTLYECLSTRSNT